MSAAWFASIHTDTAAHVPQSQTDSRHTRTHHWRWALQQGEHVGRAQLQRHGAAAAAGGGAQRGACRQVRAVGQAGGQQGVGEGWQVWQGRNSGVAGIGVLRSGECVGGDSNSHLVGRKGREAVGRCARCHCAVQGVTVLCKVSLCCARCQPLTAHPQPGGTTVSGMASGSYTPWRFTPSTIKCNPLSSLAPHPWQLWPQPCLE